MKDWNKSIQKLTKNDDLVKSLQILYSFNKSIASLKLLLFQLVCKIDDNHTRFKASDVTKLMDQLISDDKVKLIAGLSVLETCLLIAIKHHCDIYDNEPFNFEIIFARFNKFAYKSTTMQNIEREMALKRFENLKVRFITSSRNSLITSSLFAASGIHCPVWSRQKSSKRISNAQSSIFQRRHRKRYSNLQTSTD